MSKACITLLGGLFLLLLAGRLQGQTNFWISANRAGGASQQTSPEIEALLGEPTEILLWTKPTTTLENFSLNIVSTSETVLEFDNVVVHNGDDETQRFEFVFDSLNGLVVESGFCDFEGFDFEVIPTHAIWDMRGFSINEGVGASGISAAGDEGSLLATITLTGLSLGSSELFLQIGEIGLNEIGQSTFESNVRFGSQADALLNAELNRCVNSVTSDATISVVEALSLASILGDFNDDGLVNAIDIDLLSAEVLAGSNTPLYDVTGDSKVNGTDREFWVQTIKKTVFGDADLDRSVGFTDFLIMRGGFGQAGGWALGDFDGDAIVGFTDFLMLSDSFGTSLATTEAVPEPANGAPWMLSMLLLCARGICDVGRTKRSAVPAMRR